MTFYDLVTFEAGLAHAQECAVIGSASNQVDSAGSMIWKPVWACSPSCPVLRLAKEAGTGWINTEPVQPTGKKRALTSSNSPTTMPQRFGYR